ncbi:MAG: hypothetical protein GF331_08615 [Chitinivibrionales bacterium]|nr:hypothetical protein [Chitinivibrionales bacterium]
MMACNWIRKARGAHLSAGPAPSRGVTAVLLFAATAALCDVVTDGLPAAAVEWCDRIDQYGIEWHFADKALVGRFANGDYWVIGPVTITGIAPAFDGGDNGWEVNPRVAGPQGFCADAGDFDASLVPPLPYRARPGESLVKTVRSGERQRGHNCRGCLRVAAVLTVLSAIPPDSGTTVFRPPYVADRKELHSVSELRLDLLPAYPHIAGAPPLAWVEAAFARVQFDHKGGRVGRNLHPLDNIPDYGADIASRNADAALRLMLDDPPAVKMQALVNYVQYGIDLHAMARDGHQWGAGGGHRPGQKLPMAFAAAMLDNAEMARRVLESGFFHEDNLVYRSRATGVVLYGSDKGHDSDALEEGYWYGLYTHVREGRARGYKAYRDPYGLIDGGVEPGGAYQHCCTSQPWKGEVLACHLMPSLKALWPSPVLYDYVDRWVTHGAWTQPDSCAPPDTAWELYGKTFGPDGRGGCIADTDPSDGIGRFPRLHGVARDGGARRSRFQAALWNAYRDVPSPHNTHQHEDR